jgi:hypothetical protein
MAEVGCAKCGRPMPAERQELGFPCCKECSPQGRPKGVVVYSHKTAGVLELVYSEEAFRAMKRSADSGVESL